MTQLLGFLLVLVLIGAGLAATGAEAVLAALPFELMLIAGAALGTLLIANGPGVARAALGGFAAALRGSRWSRGDFADLLAVLHELCRRVRRGGHVAIEGDIETPSDSALLARAPRLVSDGHARAMLCDAFRLMSLDLSKSGRAEAQMQRAIDMAVAERMRAVGALHTVADALPALGIVAAVLGIIKTMTAIDESNAVIGAMIASALLGTFLGVFLAYGLVGPIAARFGQVVEEEAVALEVIQAFLSAHAAGAPPAVAMELARAAIPGRVQPGPDELDVRMEAARFQPEAARAA